MKSEEFLDDRSSTWEEPTATILLPQGFSALRAIGHAVLSFVAFALVGTLLVTTLQERHTVIDFFIVGALGGSCGLIMLWVISSCGVNPFADARVGGLERYIADSRRLLDSSELTLGAAQGIRAYLDILEQGARTLRRGAPDKGAVEALLRMQSECASELRAVLNEIIAPLPSAVSTRSNTVTLREVVETAQRLGSFLLSSRQLTLTTEENPDMGAIRVDPRSTCPILLSAIRECVKLAEPRSIIVLSIKEVRNFRPRVSVRLLWLAEAVSGTAQIESFDTRPLYGLLRPLRGSLSIQNLSGSRRALEITIPSNRS